MNTSIVSVNWLHSQNNSRMVILDASMKPGPSYIPGARIFDFDKKICDQNSSLPHMMPSAEYFQVEVRKLGINQDSLIVVYDSQGIYSAPRVWWMLKSMGHVNVAVLDGGLPEWIKSGFEITNAPSTNFISGHFVAREQHLFCNADTVASALESKDTYIIDARSHGRFIGAEKEPREGLRPGHMPHALNLPFKEIMNENCLKSPQEIKKAFDKRFSDERKLIFSCGSGVTACIVALAAEVIGQKNLRVYDGSWSEWGLPSARPVVK